jgi:hypothetical protein
MTSTSRCTARLTVILAAFADGFRSSRAISA